MTAQSPKHVSRPGADSGLEDFVTPRPGAQPATMKIIRIDDRLAVVCTSFDRNDALRILTETQPPLAADCNSWRASPRSFRSGRKNGCACCCVVRSDGGLLGGVRRNYRHFIFEAGYSGPAHETPAAAAEADAT